MSDIKYKDYPIHDCIQQSNELLAKHPHARIHQKFTCAGCGQRLTVAEPNAFYAQGTCDKCSTVTDITVCNYLVMATL